jgi:hypothetical protein
MSRSYKKVAGWTDHGKNTWQDKREASKMVRKFKGILNGGLFKRIFDSYNISDYKFLEFKDPSIKEDHQARGK